ncbi:MAG: hypothetical protein HY329_15660 [Chloroflexi bacterium]|nr:hypothetical protein [Chloroflexota bacterium]
MQRWEYCVLSPNRLWSVADNKQQSSHVPDWILEVAELGRQGWEAVGYDSKAGNLLFKRPLP